MPRTPEMGLDGVRIIVTRAKGASGEMAEPLAARGATIILSPALRFAAPEDLRPADAALRSASSYAWAIFTSVNGVEATGRRLEFLGLSFSVFRNVRLVAIGPATAEALRRNGLTVQIVPEYFQAEGILDALEGESLSGARVLLARAAKARDLLPDTLRKHGALIDVVAVYRTLPCDPTEQAIAVLTDHPGPRLVITFTSSSTVANFLDPLPPRALDGARGSVAAAIGPVTAADLRRRGIEPAILPSEFTIPALVSAITRHYA